MFPKSFLKSAAEAPPSSCSSHVHLNRFPTRRAPRDADLPLPPSHLLGPPQTSSDLLRPPQTSLHLLGPPRTSSDPLRPPCTSSDLLRPPRTSSDLLRPPRTSSDLLRLPQTTSDLRRLPQTSADLLRPQTTSDLLRPPQTSSDLLGPPWTSSDLLRPPQTRLQMSLSPEVLSLQKLARKWFFSLPTPSHCQVTYVFINSDGTAPKCKTRILDYEPKTIEDVPLWQATANLGASEITLVPVRIYRDPFTLDPNKLVLCETRELDGTAAPGNTRQQCVETMEAVKDHQPWFGFEQEFVLMTLEGLPFGWASSTPSDTVVAAQVGLDKVCGRDLSISHCRACLYAGVMIAGTTAEGLPSQWEYQVGPCGGVELGDHTWMSRYILLRVCEDFRLVPSFHPKPVDSPKWASGGHMNYSTRSMRAEGGLSHILSAVERLSLRHTEHMQLYGSEQGNQQRMNGVAWNPDFNTFTWAIADRKSSVRIPACVNQGRRGYLEDRRPSSDCDPYLVCTILVQTTLLHS